jgi:aminomethyltransferase
LRQTPLHALHHELGARFVPFAGYEMPVHFADGILAEHRHTRAQAGLFDVSHMGQVLLRGDDAARALESLVPADIVDLAPWRQRYALFTVDGGGILDDLMVLHTDEGLLLVVNAACKEQDIAHLRDRIGGRCEILILDDRALLALQGPRASSILSRLNQAADQLAFMAGARLDLAGAPCVVTRSGYTGEDGFEISVPAVRAADLARALLDLDGVRPVGLGARDTLRLEAGLCLYGHDLDVTTTPVEAGLRWAVSLARRPGGTRAGGYPGADVVADQLARGAPRRRVGLLPEGKAPVREGAVLVDDHGDTAGSVTSGGFGPSVGAPVAMGYVGAPFAAVDSRIQAIVRGRELPVRVAPLPFVPHRYHRGAPP